MYSVIEMATRNAYPSKPSFRTVSSVTQHSHNPTEVEIYKQRDLCRVEKDNGKYGGYKKDILAENLTNREMVFLICETCNGVMKEACISSNRKHHCSCCRVQDWRTRYKQNRDEPVRKMVDSLMCSCPLSKRGCKWLGTLKDCEDHLDTCGYVGDDCKLGCEAVLRRNELTFHEREKCPLRRVSCGHCSGELASPELFGHLKQCPKMKVSCELNCGVVVCREDMTQHLKKDCGLMKVTCTLRCGMKLPRQELQLHLRDKCAFRLINCNHCKKEFKFRDLMFHKMTCPKMKVLCGLKCGVTVCREDMAQHLAKDCVEKEIKCPFVKYKCKVTSIKRKYLNQHLEEKRIEHLELKLNEMEEIIVKNSEEVKQHRAEIRIHREEANQHRKQIEEYKEEIKQHMKEMDDHENRIYRMT